MAWNVLRAIRRWWERRTAVESSEELVQSTEAIHASAEAVKRVLERTKGSMIMLPIDLAEHEALEAIRRRKRRRLTNDS